MTGLKYKKVTLMSRMQITNGTCRCIAQIENIKRQSLNIIKDIVKIFKTADAQYPLNPSYEFTNDPNTNSLAIRPYADPVNVATMKKLQRLERIGLVEPVGEEHMYFAAMHS